MGTNYIVWLEDHPAGALLEEGIPVPYGFVITRGAYDAFLDHNHLQQLIQHTLDAINKEQPREVHEASLIIQKAIREAHLPTGLGEQIGQFYHDLRGREARLFKRKGVPILEELKSLYDLPEVKVGDFGQAKGENHLIHMVKEAWAGLSSENEIMNASTSSPEIRVQRVVQGRIEGVSVSNSPDAISPTSPNSLTDTQQKNLDTLLKAIQDHLYFPQEVSWVLEGETFFVTKLLPSHPEVEAPIQSITPEETEIITELHADRHPEILAMGTPIAPGIKTGVPIIINRIQDLEKVTSNSILVASDTTPEFLPAMKRAVGIITETGGQSSHTAVATRNLGIPTITNVIDAKRLLSGQKIVTINGSTGHILRGKAAAGPVDLHSNSFHTKTKIYVSTSELEGIDALADKSVDGLGVISGELLLAELGGHPKELLKNGRRDELVAHLTENLTHFASAFHPRPVLYKCADIMSHEHSLFGGPAHAASSEDHPLLGFHGASAIAADPSLFLAEMEAIQNVSNKGLQNITIVLPFVRRSEEIAAIFQHIPTKTSAWMTVETPSVVLTLDRYIGLNIEGVIISSLNLSMLTTGFDYHNSSTVSQRSNRDQGVVQLMRKAISTASHHGIPSFIIGRDMTDDSEVLEQLMKEGLTGVCVQRDALERARMTIHDIENTFHNSWQK